MHPILFEVAGRPVYSFGTFLAVGFFLAYWYAGWRCSRIGVSDAHVLNIFIILIVAGVAGSRILAIAIDPGRYPDFASVMRVSNGGLAFHGGLVLALAGGVSYLWARGLPIAATLDCYAPAVPLAHASGRVGCFLYGCCYGRVTDVPWALAMPPGGPDGLWPLRHPTQLYELGLLLVLTWALHRAIDWKHRPGLVMVYYGYGYPLIRFPLEFIRADNLLEPHPMGLTVGQLACVAMAVLAGLSHLLLRRWPPAPAAAA